MRLAGVKICRTVRICQSLCRGRCPHRPLQRITFRIHKKILPSRRFGTRACRFRGATQIRRLLQKSPSCAEQRAARPGDFGAKAPYTRARRTSFPVLLQEPFSKTALSLGQAGNRYCFRVMAGHYKIIGSSSCFSSSCASPDRRAAAPESASPPRPDLSRTEHWTSRTDEACA